MFQTYTEKFFHTNQDVFKKIFDEKNYSVQTYFYLRITQPHKVNPKYKPINFHRERFQGPSFFKYIMNIWIPIKNCEKKNSIKFVRESHLFKKYKDFNLKIRETNIKKGSTENKIGLLFLMEGADPIRNLTDLDDFYQKGLRVLGLTWNKENNYGFGSNKSGPLKKDGYKLIEEMNKKKITLDLSHLSYESFWGAINATNLIPIATHSNGYFIRRHKRNLTASQLKAISNKGGTCGLVLYNDFIALKSSVTMDDLFNQFKYLLSKCGEDHIALGSDIDGASIDDFPIGVRKSSDLYKIIEMLERKRISSRIIDKFASENILRVLSENLN